MARLAATWLAVAAGPLLAGPLLGPVEHLALVTLIGLGAAVAVRAVAARLAAAPVTAFATEPARGALVAVAAAAGSLGFAISGLGAAVGLLLGVAFAAWLVADAPSLLPAPLPSQAVPVVLGTAAGLSAVAAAGIGPLPAPLLLVLLVVAVGSTAAWPTGSVRLGATIERGTVRVAAAVVTVLLGAVGLLVVALPWAVQRLVRWDPLWVPHRGPGRWVARSSEPSNDHDLWARDPRRLRTTPGRRLHRAGATLGALVVFVTIGATVAIQIDDQQARDHLDVPALRRSPWAYDLQVDMDLAFSHSDITSYLGIVLPDVRSRWLNVTRGVRRTWTPPTGTCRPLRIWLMGGSTVYGVGQRDGWTIASWLARLAWKEGVPLEVQNRGVPLDVHWNEGRRVEAALRSGTSAKPDLVAFYDGINDIDVQSMLNGQGQGGARLFASYLDVDELRSAQQDRERFADLRELVHQPPAISKPYHPILDGDTLATFIADGYAAAGQQTADLLRSHAIASAWFYQPSRASRARPVAGEGQNSSEGEGRRDLERAVDARLPDTVTDLSDALDGYRRPVYLDWVHTNEDGARIVAEAMLDHLRPKLRSLLAERGGSRCR